ncbi:MAG: 16S rRNA (guanine(527)-N(7))-methyltransferase RsmG [Cyclobacteriaceae bacterium]|nr:16S rRNA (guanine(527)-N(7))-methyltransferase RsmG [Cyclobacteriaceae bacterium]
MDLILKYFPGLTEKQKEQFGELPGLYSTWNQKINLISRKDIQFIDEKHVLHSLAIAKFMNFRPGTYIMDAGTGGGFPGIPLSILFPEARFLLVDSIGKKVQAVKEIAASLELHNVAIKQERIEKITDKFDYIISRAVTELSRFLRWTNGKINRSGYNEKPNGIIYLKGGDLTSEARETGRYIEIYDISTYFRESFFSSKKLVFIPQTK